MYAEEAKSEASSSTPFLDDNSEDGLEVYSQPPQKNKFLRSFFPWMIHLGIFFMYSLAIFWMNGLLQNVDCRAKLLYSPMESAIQYEKISYDGQLETENRFRGEPRPELDAAWQSLFKNNNVRISKEEITRMNQSSIELADGSGYYGQISAYHHLHCLKFLRQLLHNDYYKISDSDRFKHMDHCVDDIRQALMCNADTTVVMWDWKPNYRKPWPNFSLDHECVKWDLLDEWASERSFSLFDQKSLVHPDLGLAYPLVDGKIETVSHGPEMHIVWPEGHGNHQ